MKLGMTEDDARATERKYTKSNRDQWGALGYRMLSAKVHDEERLLILAELEVRKFQRLAHIAEDKETDNATLYRIATRNMAKAVSTAKRKKAEEEAEHSRAKREVLHFLDQCRHYGRKYHGVKNNYDPEAPYDTRVRMEAKGVAYANLAASYYKLAQVRLEHAGRTSIFGLRGDDHET